MSPIESTPLPSGSYAFGSHYTHLRGLVTRRPEHTLPGLSQEQILFSSAGVIVC